jgi:hypothetical protein
MTNDPKRIDLPPYVQGAGDLSRCSMLLANYRTVTSGKTKTFGISGSFFPNHPN